MARLTPAWAALADALPIYPLYTLLFADHGLADGQISGLFAIWSATAVLAEVPTGALADRFSRRHALVASGVLQAMGYAVWVLLPGFAGFAAGFVMWGVGGALASGALEALLYDGLAAEGAEQAYARISGRVSAAGLVGQIPAAVGATLLFPLGSYALVGWVSVGLCLCASAVALRLPEIDRRQGAGQIEGEQDDPGYLAVLRAGLDEAVRSRVVRRAVIAAAAVEGIDAIEEYFPLLAHDWGVSTQLTPLAILAIPLTGAVGAILGGRAMHVGARSVASCLGIAGLLLASAALAHRAAGIVLVALFYGVYHLVLVVVDARLQERIEGSSRATVVSVAALATEVSVFGVYAAWTVGGPLIVALTVCAFATCLTRLVPD